MSHEQMARLFRLVAINAYRVYLGTLIGNPPPGLKALGERITNPEPGDLVLETSTIYKWAKDSEQAPLAQYPALGVLLRKTREPFPGKEEDADPVTYEDVWYLRPIDGSVSEYRWTNANFIQVKESLHVA